MVFTCCDSHVKRKSEEERHTLWWTGDSFSVASYLILIVNKAEFSDKETEILMVKSPAEFHIFLRSDN